jgi:hypothetical protein
MEQIASKQADNITCEICKDLIGFAKHLAANLNQTHNSLPQNFFVCSENRFKQD